MAQHYPIGQAGFDIVFKHIIKRLHITRMNNFQHEFVPKLGCYMKRLPVDEYRMDEEHGKKDHFVIYFYKSKVDSYSYEVHLDKDLNVNEVYQVL